MGVSAQEHATHGDEDHGLGDIKALLIVAHEAPPAGHPAEGAFDHPSARQNLEALLVVAAADDLDGEIEESGLIHEL